MFENYIKKLFTYRFPQFALTLYAGFWARMTIPIVKNRLISRFIDKYGVNMQEAQIETIDGYSCFNDFFIRRLKPDARPIASADIISPVDGVISEIGAISAGQMLQAKGHYYSVQELLACDSNISAQFENGHFATLYLSPKDYHRVHMPLDATLLDMIYVPGELFSVQPATARSVPKLFARNERLVVFFQTKIGLMAMVLVGAVIVGNIGTAWSGDIRRSRQSKRTTYADNTVLQKADEMGYFKLGSTVILLFADHQAIRWRDNLRAETPIQFGQALGDFI